VKWNWPFVYDFSATPFNASRTGGISPEEGSRENAGRSEQMIESPRACKRRSASV